MPTRLVFPIQVPLSQCVGKASSSCGFDAMGIPMGSRCLMAVSVAFCGLVLSLCAAGCEKRNAEKDAKPLTSKPTDPTRPGLKSDPCAMAKAHQGSIRWIHDDYANALACAKQRNKPLVIDAWAPWCHTCLSMKHYVLVDKAFAPLAERFVWLAIDTDKAVNAEVVGKYPQKFWPTFFIVGSDEAVYARFQGAATVRQFREFLNQGEQGVRRARKDSGVMADPALIQISDGDRAAVVGDWKAAAAAYRKALSNQPDGWPRKPDVLVSLIGALHEQEAWGACLQLADTHMNQTGRAASAADFVYYATVCAERAADSDEARAKKVTAAATKRLTGLIADQAAPLSIDDRGDAMRLLRELVDQSGDKKAAKRIAQSQRELLDQAAREAPNPWVAMTYNWPRAEVYAYLNKAAELVPDLKKSVAALPNQYDPPYRLSWVYYKLGQHAKALDMAKRTVGLAYGPRKARVQGLIAMIEKARGNKKAERAARREVVETYEKLPAGHRRPDALERAKEELAELDS